VWLADTNIVEEILELKQSIRVYFYLRYRRKKKQQERRTTVATDSVNSGKLILYPNEFQLVWLWFVMLYNCRLHNKVEDQYV